MATLDDVRKANEWAKDWTDSELLSYMSDVTGRPFDDLAGEYGRPVNNSTLQDAGTSLKQGVQELPGMVSGVLDIIPALAFGKRPVSAAADWVGEKTGFQPGKWSEDAEAFKSQGYQQARAEIDAAWDDKDKSLLGKLATYATEPSYTGQQIVRSLPGMVAGGVAGRAVGAAGKAVGVTGSRLPYIAAGAGEGVVTAGQQLNQYDPDLPDQQRAALAALGSGVGTGVIGYAGGRVANRFGLDDPNMLLSGGKSVAGDSVSGLKGMPLRMLGGGFTEGVFEELPQSVQEQMWQNYADGKPIMEGVDRAGVEGALAGFAMGGAVNANPFAGGRQQAKEETGRAPTQPIDSAVMASEVLGASQVPEAEKALLQPRSITALDRVNEIDKEIKDASEENRAALQQERDRITASWPASVAGQQTSFSTEAGVRIDAHYALMEADDLTTSHDENLRPVQTYPQELQPRERERAASEMQVSSIAQKLDPARLGISADAATGAPIVGADGLVESGNARTIALKRVYQSNDRKANNYKDFIKANAEQLGIAPEVVDSMERPVLVRVRDTPVNRAEEPVKETV